ncbi:translation initiation factor IF-2-like [Equus quagga]|uniref:translation initiation factor IF-2-like n=1 Tax=Equus quagga TaxID=89248 RepID=UPI001EE1BF88|nr:translation initiation factor IF-2-like [Equus quagga]
MATVSHGEALVRPGSPPTRPGSGGPRPRGAAYPRAARGRPGPALHDSYDPAVRFKGRRPPGGSPARAFVRSAAPAQPGPHPAPHSPHLRPAQHAPRTPTWPARLAAPALPGSHPAPAPAPLLASRLAPRIPHPASSTCACSPGGLQEQPRAHPAPTAACRSCLVARAGTIVPICTDPGSEG